MWLHIFSTFYFSSLISVTTYSIEKKDYLGYNNCHLLYFTKKVFLPVYFNFIGISIRQNRLEVGFI